MNDFIQQVYAGWNNGLTTDENLYREIKELKFTVDTTTYPIRFKPKFAANPKGFNLIYYRESNGVAFTQVPCINLDIGSGGLVELSSIGGLTNGSTYTLRLEVIYG